jgi:hypothetical protein
VRVAEHDARPHRDQAVHEEEPALEELLVDQHGAPALGGQHQGERREVGREARPRRVVDLGDRPVGVRGHPQLLGAGHDQRGAVQGGLHPEAPIGDPDHAQVVGHHVAHAHLAAGHGGQGHEGPDLDVIGAQPMPTGTELADALDAELVGADAGDARPERVEEAA